MTANENIQQSNVYASASAIGGRYNASAASVNDALVFLGLRTLEGEPTDKAMRQKFAGDGRKWHVDAVCQLLEQELKWTRSSRRSPSVKRN